MSFIIDKQTIDDLAIFGKRGRDSVFSLFNQTSTRGGAEVLEQMFRYPLTDPLLIQQRISILKYFQGKGLIFPFRGELFDTAEHYLSNVDERTKLSQNENMLERKFHTLIGSDTEYQLILKGVLAIRDILQTARAFIDELIAGNDYLPYKEEISEIEKILIDTDLASVAGKSNNGKLSYDKTASLDKILRFQKWEEVKKLLYYCYNLDVYLTVAGVATKQGYVFPEVLPLGSHVIYLEGVYHPLVAGAIGNTISINPESNIIFLTGANMAGKSTFMKSLGTAVYLAHMGFPVAAKKMEFSARDGLFTTINLPDNLSMGYSHFYAEVLRVKKVAEQLSRSKNLFIIFDELFRGTNVKDAYEATVAITESFARKRNCMFVVSTHIIEAGEVLRERCDNIHFTYLPTVMDGNKPVYTYQLESGITADRHGMIIINNEGILDILRRSAPRTLHPKTEKHEF